MVVYRIIGKRNGRYIDAIGNIPFYCSRYLDIADARKTIADNKDFNEWRNKSVIILNIIKINKKQWEGK